MTDDLYDGPCVAGCQRFHGDETRHHKSCGHYTESLTRYFEDRIEALEARVAAAADKLAEALCAEEETAGQDVWAKLDGCEVTYNALTAYLASKEQSDD